jgi:hypothetical protein
LSNTTTEVATQSDAALLDQADLEAQLAAANQAEIDQADIQIPLLKIGQLSTTEVIEGDASAGEFINALTREGLGTDVDFIVAGYQKGRFFHGDRAAGRRARKAYGVKNVPWNDDPHYGEPFTEHPDAEETYSKRVNAGEIPWGKGPRISTTYDFTGFVISGLGEDEEPIPVCLSLMRMNSKAARKWAMLLQAVLNGKYWDAVFNLTTERKQNGDGTFYTITVKQVRKTTPEEKQKALALAMMLRNQDVEIVGEDSEASGPPPATGGMEV